MAAAQAADFNIDRAFTAFLADIGRSPGDAGGGVSFTGADPLIHSRFRIATSMALPATAAALGAAAIWKDRTGQTQDVAIDLREALYGVNPLITLIMQHRVMVGALPADDPVVANFSFVPLINDRWLQAPVGLGNPMSFVPFETKDGRFANITGAYPHLYDRALNVLKATPNRESIAAAVRTWDAEALEDALAENRAVGAIHRSTEEWAAHPEGRHLGARPLIDIVKVADSPPVPWTPNPQQPLSGIRALSLTHVIAGSTTARTLSEYGAEVLHVVRDQSFEHEAIWTDVNVGMRSTLLNLTQDPHKQALQALLPQTDVFIEGFSGRGIERLGFGVDEVVRRKPGVIYMSMRCYSWDGPWQDRGGFDMEALTVTGFTLLEGGGQPSLGENYPAAGTSTTAPAFPPTLVLNDYVAGYLGAAGVIEALRRRATEGGSYHVRISLSRAAMWYQSLGVFPNREVDVSRPEHRMVPPETITGTTCYGEVHRLAPLVKLSRTPGRWPAPLLRVRGGDRPVWES
ncbi:CoA transferase [Brevundimonas lenta]|uniref:Crotonobetainyl-CoA:carnitine CoA-transferase CaiB-like acyl-CoA transferase n=1 Tax=Brevundimonas lenta TaxID=424796 RepID=A0A7W6JBA2_9CAUL|nr:CoA transferase [Brevundimonas lenta]MBB4081951.1 crotonobetainyl-CoA:carnitine CoA-transferase CaiB-like acyl-CoA transferase [Brevundimonas lenta]